jgi:ClpP class serine protease
VDKIGGLDDAIAKAASLAKIKKLQYSKLSNMRKILMISKI